mmetsp:Transcript_81902/g.147835  ORF Transcript_81902/g.147835 Transcript_81902/m.147835 type:complete len:216 (-) Transcript_81902:1469-2116(-)
MQYSIGIAIKPDLELFPPVLSQRHSEAVGTITLSLHRSSIMPLRPGPHNCVGTGWLRVTLQSTTTPRPEHDLVPLRNHVARALFVELDVAPSYQVDIGPAEATRHDTDERAGHLVLRALREDRHRLVAQIRVRVCLSKVEVRSHYAILRRVNGLQEASQPRRFNLVAHAALHGREQERWIALLFTAMSTGHRPNLDGIGQEAASPMALHSIDICR